MAVRLESLDSRAMLSSVPFITTLPQDLAGKTASLVTVHGRYGNNALNGDWEFGLTSNTSAPPQKQVDRIWNSGSAAAAVTMRSAVQDLARPPGTWPATEFAAMSTDEGLRSHARLVQNLPNSRYASTGSRPLRIAARTLFSVAMTASTSATTSAAISAGTTTTPSQSATT